MSERGQSDAEVWAGYEAARDHLQHVMLWSAAENSSLQATEEEVTAARTRLDNAVRDLVSRTVTDVIKRLVARDAQI